MDAIGFRHYSDMRKTVDRSHLILVCLFCVSDYISQRHPRSLTAQLWLGAPWHLICSPLRFSRSPSLHPSHRGFHAPNREIHPQSQLCLQSEPSQSRLDPGFLWEQQEAQINTGPSWLIPVTALCTNDWQIFREAFGVVWEAFNLQSGTLGLHTPQHVDPFANQYDCRYWIIHRCLMICQSQLVLFYLLPTMHRFLHPLSSIAS